MYWRFGHQNASVIDHLLESGTVSLEELLEQDDLIQECKAQNPKLIEYLRDPAVLSQLLGYITSDDLEERARFKYPFIACEVMACEIWGIFESALDNVEMLVKFWEFLDRPPPLNPVQASYFAKVIGVFLMQKTEKMMSFIKSQPEVVPKLLLHMSTSAIMDLLLKIISMEESMGGVGTVQWLSEQGLMPWLVNRLDPNFDQEVHSIASQVLLDIIAISQSSHPEQPSIGTNVLIDELKSEAIVTRLVGFMLDRNAPHSTSTLINGVTIFIELIRRNNSDYDVDPEQQNSAEPAREPVDLSDLLKVLAARIEDFKDLLVLPRSVKGPIETSIGKQTPLGFERLKICEMFAELLHCSNMAVLNSRPIISVSPDGTVKVPSAGPQPTVVDEKEAQVEQIPVSTTEPTIAEAISTEPTLESKSEAEVSTATGESTGAKDAPVKEAEKTENSDAANDTQNPVKSESTSQTIVDDQATPRATSPSIVTSATFASSTVATLSASEMSPTDVLIPVGDFLKLQFVEHRIIPTCFDLFFQFPWNNFLHTVVYDMVHQVFHRPMGDIGRTDNDNVYIPPKGDLGITEGWNRRLTLSIFKDGQLTKRITDAQRLCDYECAQPKGVRLGYMGHLTYIADEAVKLLELYSQTSLLPMLYQFIDQEDWWNYVSKILKETKERDAQVLGGTRPNMVESQKTHEENDDDDFMDDTADGYGSGNNGFGGGGAGHEGDVGSDQFARYLCQQITNNLPDKFGSSDEDEDEEEGNWIGEYGAESDFDMRRANATSELDDPFGNRHALNHDFGVDSDEEDGVDEDSWNSQQWPNAFGEEKSNLDTSTQFTAKLADWSEDFQDGFTEFKSAPTGEDNSTEFGFSSSFDDDNVTTVVGGAADADAANAAAVAGANGVSSSNDTTIASNSSTEASTLENATSKLSLEDEPSQPVPSHQSTVVPDDSDDEDSDEMIAVAVQPSTVRMMVDSDDELNAIPKLGDKDTAPTTPTPSTTLTETTAALAPITPATLTTTQETPSPLAAQEAPVDATATTAAVTLEPISTATPISTFEAASSPIPAAVALVTEDPLVKPTETSKSEVAPIEVVAPVAISTPAPAAVPAEAATAVSTPAPATTLEEKAVAPVTPEVKAPTSPVVVAAPVVAAAMAAEAAATANAAAKSTSGEGVSK